MIFFGLVTYIQSKWLLLLPKNKREWFLVHFNEPSAWTKVERKGECAIQVFGMKEKFGIILSSLLLFYSARTVGANGYPREYCLACAATSSSHSHFNPISPYCSLLNAHCRRTFPFILWRNFIVKAALVIVINKVGNTLQLKPKCAQGNSDSMVRGSRKKGIAA